MAWRLLVSHLVNLGHIEPLAYSQRSVFDAGVQFAKAEGILPAPESNHAVRAAIDEAIRCKEAGKGEVILFNLSGHGHFDMQAYSDYLDGSMVDHQYNEQEVAMALSGLPSVG